MANPAILTVDDDPAVSRAIARDLRRRYGERFRVLRAVSGDDALEALREVSSGRSGGRDDRGLSHAQMNGVEFLEAAMDLFPSARRVC